MTVRATVNKVELNQAKVSKAGNPYMAHVFVYTNMEGQQVERPVKADLPIASKITESLVGKEVDIDFMKDASGFNQMTDVRLATGPAPVKKPFGGNFNKSNFNNDPNKSRDISVEAAAHDAALLVAHGKTKDFDKTMREIFNKKDAFKKELNNNTPAKPAMVQETPVAKAMPKVVEVENDEDLF